MLTLPLVLAAITTGLAGGVHCVGMCGGISTLLTQAGTRRIIPIGSVGSPVVSRPRTALRFQVLLQAGRLTTYMLIGALLGALGSAGILLPPHWPLHQILYVFGNLALIFLGLRVLGWRWQVTALSKWGANLQARLFAALPALKHGLRWPFLIGMGWGCLPCGLLYAVLPFALLSGAAWSGAVLMLLFGLCALPHLLLSQGIFQAISRVGVPPAARYAGAVLLIGLGSVGFWYVDMQNMPGFLCVVALT